MPIHSKASLAKIQNGIDTLTPFQVASMSGRLEFDTFGEMPHAWAFNLKQVPPSKITYVVYSYRTPIAWRLDCGDWVIPEWHYSATTSTHQRIVKVATSNPGHYARRGLGVAA